MKASMNNNTMIAFKRALAGDFSGMAKGLFAKKRGYKAFIKVFDEADEAFNIAENYKAYLKKRVEACKIYLKAIDDKPWLFAIATLKEQEAETLLGMGGEGEQFEFVCAQLSKNMGFKIDSNTITVAEFYSYMKIR